MVLRKFRGNEVLFFVSFLFCYMPNNQANIWHKKIVGVADFLYLYV